MNMTCLQNYFHLEGNLAMNTEAIKIWITQVETKTNKNINTSAQMTPNKNTE